MATKLLGSSHSPKRYTLLISMLALWQTGDLFKMNTTLTYWQLGSPLPPPSFPPSSPICGLANVWMRSHYIGRLFIHGHSWLTWCEYCLMCLFFFISTISHLILTFLLFKFCFAFLSLIDSQDRDSQRLGETEEVGWLNRRPIHLCGVYTKRGATTFLKVLKANLMTESAHTAAAGSLTLYLSLSVCRGHHSEGLWEEEVQADQGICSTCWR